MRTQGCSLHWVIAHQTDHISRLYCTIGMLLSLCFWQLASDRGEIIAWQGESGHHPSHTSSITTPLSSPRHLQCSLVALGGWKRGKGSIMALLWLVTAATVEANLYPDGFARILPFEQREQEVFNWSLNSKVRSETREDCRSGLSGWPAHAPWHRHQIPVPAWLRSSLNRQAACIWAMNGSSRLHSVIALVYAWICGQATN
jgi:hypothetical protein